jgi:hypothetical protein
MMSDSLALNKMMASILVGGIVFLVSGFIADGLVHPQHLAKTAIKIDVPITAPVATAAAADSTSAGLGRCEQGLGLCQ